MTPVSQGRNLLDNVTPSLSPLSHLEKSSNCGGPSDLLWVSTTAPVQGVYRDNRPCAFAVSPNALDLGAADRPPVPYSPQHPASLYWSPEKLTATLWSKHTSVITPFLQMGKWRLRDEKFHV